MFNHYSVLLNETINGLKIKPNGIYIDATMGGAGHSQLILKNLTSGKLICFDQDILAINNAKEIFKTNDNVIIIHDNFVNFDEHLKKLNINKIDGIIFDLGVSSMQIDLPERGFSYLHDAHLDMRMNQEQTLTAKDVINNYSQKELEIIFQKYGEEKFSKQIATNICNQRIEKPINTTLELVEIIKEAIPKKFFYKLKGHPAKRIFQAIRIEVNKELIVFEQALEKLPTFLNENARICVITFHSLEDRICKYYFKKMADIDDSIKKLPMIPKEYQPFGKVITKKPIYPTSEEIAENSRSKSAKLRIFEVGYE